MSPIKKWLRKREIRKEQNRVVDLLKMYKHFPLEEIKLYDELKRLERELNELD